MSSITLPTRQLVGLLSDVVLTACTDPELPLLCTVLLHSDRGEWATKSEDDPDDTEPLIDVVPSDLLIGSSTNRVMVGQAHTACGGQLLAPVLVSAADVKAIVAVFKPLVSSLGKEITHRAVLEYSASTKTLEVCEDPTQVPDGLSMSVPTLDVEGYPDVTKVMEPDPTMPASDRDHVVIEPSYGTGVTASVLEVLAKVSKRRVMPVAWYRHHQHRGVVVEISASYRAVFQPTKLDEDAGQQMAPTVRVFTPNLPSKVAIQPLTPA